MRKSSSSKQLLLHRIESHRAIFRLETRIFRGEVDSHLVPAQRAFGIFRQLKPIGATLRAGFQAAKALILRRRRG